jgi:hypothetical protein
VRFESPHAGQELLLLFLVFLVRAVDRLLHRLLDSLLVLHAHTGNKLKTNKQINK